MKWSPVLSCRTVGVGGGWDGGGQSHMVVIVLLESSHWNLEKMLTSYSSQVIFFKILITSIIHQKKTQVVSICTEHNSVYTYCVDGVYKDFSYVYNECPAQAGEQGLGANSSKILGFKDLFEVTDPACG